MLFTLRQRTGILHVIRTHTILCLSWSSRWQATLRCRRESYHLITDAGEFDVVEGIMNMEAILVIIF